MADTTCPTFYPTWDEFKDFRRYINQIDGVAKSVGLCKIVPPKEWKDLYALSEEALAQADFSIPRPIAQHVGGGRGIFSVELTEQKPMTALSFRALALKRESGERDLEKRVRSFWKGLGSNMTPPVYGADTPGSLFDEQEGSRENGWNVARLDSELKLLRRDLPGVTSSMLYAGMWRAMFAFHTEDLELYSINVLHGGAPKSWYSIPPSFASRFESLMQSLFPEGFRHCAAFLRHKTSLVSPNRLKSSGISFTTCVQSAGDIVITFPRSYHGGFNHGWNIAESANFCTARWFDIGRNANVCHCRPFTVRIDVDELEASSKEFVKLHGDSGFAASALIDEGEEAVEEAEVEARERRRRLMRRGKLDKWRYKADDDWVFSCSCGEVSLSTDPRDEWPEGLQFECASCGVWCHAQCVYGKRIRAVENLPVPPSCHLCQDEDKVLNQKKGKKRKQPVALVWNDENESADEGVVLEMEDGQARIRFKQLPGENSRVLRDEWVPLDSLLRRGDVVRRKLRRKLLAAREEQAESYPTTDEDPDEGAFVASGAALDEEQPTAAASSTMFADVCGHVAGGHTSFDGKSSLEVKLHQEEDGAIEPKTVDTAPDASSTKIAHVHGHGVPGCSSFDGKSSFEVKLATVEEMSSSHHDQQRPRGGGEQHQDEGGAIKPKPVDAASGASSTKIAGVSGRVAAGCASFDGKFSLEVEVTIVGGKRSSHHDQQQPTIMGAHLPQSPSGGGGLHEGKDDVVRPKPVDTAYAGEKCTTAAAAADHRTIMGAHLPQSPSGGGGMHEEEDDVVRPKPVDTAYAGEKCTAAAAAAAEPFGDLSELPGKTVAEELTLHHSLTTATISSFS